MDMRGNSDGRTPRHPVSGKKVLILSAKDSGGAGIAAYRLHRGLVAAGVDSRMIVLHKEQKEDRTVGLLQLRHNGQDLDPWQSFCLAMQTAQQELRDFPARPQDGEFFSTASCRVSFRDLGGILGEADIINIHWCVGLFDYLGAPQALHGKKVVWTLHDMNAFTGGCHYAGECTRYREARGCRDCPQLGQGPYDLAAKIWAQKQKVLKSLDITVVCPSKWLSTCASASVIFRDCRHELIPYGLPLDEFCPVARQQARERFGLPLDREIVLFGSESIKNRRKGFDLMLSMMRSLPQKCEQWQNVLLVTFGNPDVQFPPDLPIRSLGVLNSTEDIACAYSAADVYVITSREDNLPNTVLESLACGTPVAGFNIGGIPDMVCGPHLGLLVEPFDCAALAGAVAEILRQGRGKYANGCRTDAQRRYALSRQSEDYLDLFSRLEDTSLKDNTGLLVSAIVSTYKSERYIRAAIEDLFAQTLYAKGQMEIVIINSNSPENEDEIIRELIAGRPNVVYHKTPERETLYKAWNRAIELSSGKYITNANTDDRHLPHALERMAQALEARADCILAYADIAVTDDPQVTVGASPVPCQYRWPEYDRQLYFINSFAGPQPMWRRSAHERYGFFDPEMKSAGDYDLFLRFAAGDEKFLHIPEVLGLMLRSNDSVGLSNAELTARETVLARNRSWRAEWGQMPPSQGIPVVVPVPAGVDPYTYQRPAQQPQGAPAAQSPGNSIPGRLQQLVQRHRQEPGNQQVLADLRRLREAVAQFLLDVPEGQLAAALQGELGQCLKLITESALRDEPLLAHEQANADELRSRLADPKFSQELREKFTFCHMLYRYAHQQELPFEGLPLKGRALGNFLEYMLYNPEIFLQIGEAERFAMHIGDTTAGLRRWLEREPEDPHCRQAVNFFLNRENFINMYFNSLDTRQMYEDRAALMSAGLRQAGLPLGWQPPRREKKRGKLRVGFFNSHFGPQTETYTSIPHFEHLDRERFELYLYTFSAGDNALTRYCQGLTANFRILPVKDLPAAAAAIRGDDLDVLVIGTNVTAVTNPAALLACFRLARAQLVNNSCPVTSGFPEVDGYISGDLVETGDYQHLYSEKVYLVRGTAHCFAYETDNIPPQRSFTRAEFGIPAGAVVFSSGANFYKIIPELKSTWAKILAQVPGSYLLLHPFNPNWSNAYPRERFLASFRAELARHGVDASRLIISMNALPTRSDIVELWKVSDIYLDSFPFAGVNSTVDPLDAGVPVVIWEGEMFRSRMAGSLLRELKIEEYIAHSEEEYIALAARLANDAQLRGEVAEKIRRAMADNPCFYDRRNFSAEVGRTLEQAAADFSR